jgi:hypothetical protein
MSAPTLLEAAGDAARVIHATLCGSSCAPVCDDLRSAIAAEEARLTAIPAKCPLCRAVIDPTDDACPICGGGWARGGTGEARQAADDAKKCPECNGSGTAFLKKPVIKAYRCATCGGTGERKP